MSNYEWAGISPEGFQDLCIALLFREGYRTIIPLGSRGVKESGKDAIEVLYSGASEDSGHIIFQFKRWTADYKDADLKRLIRKELDDKIVPSAELVDQYILVTCHSLTTLKQWILQDLSQNYPFPIRVFERAWLENRLENESQDLRRRYFGLDIERHSLEGLRDLCTRQVQGTIAILGSNYVPELYVNRAVEKDFEQFMASDQSSFVIVDRSGRGKTNLLCHLAETYSKRMPVVFITGHQSIVRDEDLAVQITTELGYAGRKGSRWQADLEDLERVVANAHLPCLVIIDGISENYNIRMMKNAVRELLARYGGKSCFKFCISCRDTLWSRFVVDLPLQYIYQVDNQRTMVRTDAVNYGVSLGDWSREELREAIAKYQAHFNVTFHLLSNAEHQCRYPLLLRLLCETYSGKALGAIDILPLYQLLGDFLSQKVHRIADLANLNVPADSLHGALLKIRTQMWSEDDTSEIREESLSELLAEMRLGQPGEIIYRMLDEGLFLKTVRDDESVYRFGFDELADYLLYLTLIRESRKKGLSIREVIREQVQLLRSQETSPTAERFLVLISRSLGQTEDMEALLTEVLAADLMTFAKCAWQRLLVEPHSNESNEDKISNFGRTLVDYYEQIVNTYFQETRAGLAPFSLGGSGALGIDMRASPNLREVSYRYQLRAPGSNAIRVTLTDDFPTWNLSLQDQSGKKVELHDPDHGIMVSVIRGPDGPLRTLDFEWNSPFPGVSIIGPDRIALYDLGGEIETLLDSHALSEPFDLLRERAKYLARSMPRELTEARALPDFDTTLDKMLSSMPMSRERSTLAIQGGEFRYYLATLKESVFGFDLPKPDIATEQAANPWKSYSIDGLREYLAALFSNFIGIYKFIVETNFPSVSFRMNLYNQLPAQLILLMNPSSDSVRIFALPEEEEMGLKIIQTTASNPDVVSDGKLTIDQLPYDVFVHKAFRQYKRYRTNSYPVDRLMPLKDLFGEAPVNGLVYSWLHSELADLFQIP